VDTKLPYRFEQTPLQLTVYIPFESKPIGKLFEIIFKGQFVSVKRKNSEEFYMKVGVQLGRGFDSESPRVKFHNLLNKMSLLGTLKEIILFSYLKRNLKFGVRVF
jgi:hypothetical protein